MENYGGFGGTQGGRFKVHCEKPWEQIKVYVIMEQDTLEGYWECGGLGGI